MRKIFKFFKNIFLFRKELWDHRSFDYCYTLSIFKRSLELQRIYLEKYGNEIYEDRKNKIDKINRVNAILENIIDDLYYRMAEKELGLKFSFKEFKFKKVEGRDFHELITEDTPEETAVNNRIFKKARELEKEEWDELFEILKGREEDISDGSCLLSWWD